MYLCGLLNNVLRESKQVDGVLQSDGKLNRLRLHKETAN